jgi:hypothetical protein
MHGRFLGVGFFFDSLTDTDSPSAPVAAAVRAVPAAPAAAAGAVGKDDAGPPQGRWWRWGDSITRAVSITFYY